MDPHQLSSLLHPDLAQIIRTVGYVGVFAIVFAESGLFFGFFLPGDSLLFTAGFLASQGVFDLAVLAIGCFIAAVAGDQVGYAFGRRVGRPLFHREDSLFFHRKHLERAERFYERHGGKAIILARFMPVVRTFAPIVAGVGQMHYRRFVTFNVVGGALWAVGVTVAGYFLGAVIPDVDKYLLPIIFLIVVASVAPPALHVLRDPEQREAIFRALRRSPKREGAAPASPTGRAPGAPRRGQPETAPTLTSTVGTSSDGQGRAVDAISSPSSHPGGAGR